MSIRLRTVGRLAALAIVTGGLSGFGGQIDAATSQVPFQLLDCFGHFYTGAFATGVIFADPLPAITFGTAGDDVIIGSDFADKIYGLGGNDVICAGDGWDYVEGGLLVDTAASDVDQIDGGTGVDVLHGGHDDDVIHGGSNFTPADSYGYHDFLYGDTGDDTLFGESGADVLDGGYGVDHCDGGTGMAGSRPEDDGVTAYCNTAVNYEFFIPATP